MDTMEAHSSTNISPHHAGSNAVKVLPTKKTQSSIQTRTLSPLELNNKALAEWNDAMAHDCSKNLPYSFDILTNTLPNSIRPFFPYAYEIESHLFINAPRLFKLNNNHSVKSVQDDPSQTLLTKFYKYSGASGKLAFEDLILFGKSSDDFFAVLNNYGKGCLLNIVEKLLHEPSRIYHMQYRFNTVDIMREQVLIAMLSANVDENRIRKVFKSGVYRYNRLTKQVGNSLFKNGNYTTDPIGWQNMIQNNIKCRFASLIVSLYCISMHVLLGHKAKKFIHLDFEDLPHSISYIIATACYLSVREIYNAMYFKYWSKSFFLEFFPNIEDIFELLELIAHDHVQPVYCIRCGSPFFCERNPKKSPYLNQQQTAPSCPNCQSKTYFRLSDIEG